MQRFDARGFELVARLPRRHLVRVGDREPGGDFTVDEVAYYNRALSPAEVAEQYEQFGGRSPINDHCRELIAALEGELADAGRVRLTVLAADGRVLADTDEAPERMSNHLGRPEVRDALKSRYRMLLVDEFQDTDPLQYEIVLFLAEREGGRARDPFRAELEPGRLFIVGDPKQTIYGWRDADLGAYEDFVKSDAVTEKVFKVFRMHEPQEVFVPLADLRGSAGAS